MDFETYEREKQSDYEALATVVASILNSAICADHTLRLQQVQHRAKEPMRLKKKLEKLGCVDSKKIETDVKDLAGCRLVFYTNADVRRFLISGTVDDNFDINWDRTKIHYPNPDSVNTSDLFISNNYVVKLKEDHVALREYKHFHDMWCEVQVQTTLNHAWSELAHDTIYKSPELKGFGQKLFETIENRMNTIMREYLIPVGYEFQKVVDDFERLSAGKELFDQGALVALGDCDNNNARYDCLRRFKDYVLPHYNDLASVYPDIRRSVVGAVEDARKTPVRVIPTEFGPIPGQTVEQIVSLAVDILRYVRYIDVEATFDSLCDLYLKAESDVERESLLQLAEDLSKYELSVWNRAGPFVQSILVDKIKKLDDELLEPHKPILIRCLAEILKPEVRGISFADKVATIQTGPTQMSDVLAHVRTDAISLLKQLYRTAKTDAERWSVIDTFSEGMRSPRRVENSSDLYKAILENSIEIVEFYTEMADCQGYEITRTREHELLWLYRHNCNSETADVDVSSIAEVRENLAASIMVFRDRVNRDRDFVVHKTLIGYDSVFLLDWESEEFDHERQRLHREQKIRELVKEVSQGNSEDWLTILKRCAGTESNDSADFSYFYDYLEQLGERKPEIALQFLDQLDEKLGEFLSSMLLGLSKSRCKDDMQGRISKWISERAYLQHIALYLCHSDEFDVKLLEKILKAGIECGNCSAVLNVLRKVTKQYTSGADDIIGTLFISALEYLSEKKSQRWVIATWPTPLLLDLNSDQADTVLQALIPYANIDYHSEMILTPIAQNFPAKVIHFFGKRLELEENKAACDGYQAIPFKLHKLYQPLAENPDNVVNVTREWFHRDNSLFSYRAGRMVPIIFPTLSEGIQNSLISLISSGEKRDIEFVIKVLQSYGGKVFPQDVCEKLIDELPSNDPLLEEVETALNSTGVLRGEYGLVEAYKNKRTAMEPWISHSNEKVQAFAIKYIHSLDQYIAAEQRHTEELIELQKRKYEGN